MSKNLMVVDAIEEEKVSCKHSKDHNTTTFESGIVSMEEIVIQDDAIKGANYSVQE